VRPNRTGINYLDNLTVSCVRTYVLSWASSSLRRLVQERRVNGCPLDEETWRQLTVRINTYSAAAVAGRLCGEPSRGIAC
jgi:hypothetical protein